jgi:hypothetical protein
MWLRFDLTNGEFTRMCSKADINEHVDHCMGYYTNLRKQMFDRLDILTNEFLTAAKTTDAGPYSEGWLRPNPLPRPRRVRPQIDPLDGDDGSETDDETRGLDMAERFPNVPSNDQVVDALPKDLAWYQKLWAPIDILTDEAWKNPNEPAVIIAVDRAHTYVKYRAASLQEKKPLSMEEKTRMYVVGSRKTNR